MKTLSVENKQSFHHDLRRFYRKDDILYINLKPMDPSHEDFFPELFPSSSSSSSSSSSHPNPPLTPFTSASTSTKKNLKIEVENRQIFSEFPEDPIYCFRRTMYFSLTLCNPQDFHELNKSDLLRNIISSLNPSELKSQLFHLVLPLSSTSFSQHQMTSFPLLLNNKDFESFFLSISPSTSSHFTTGTYVVERKLYRAKQMEVPFSFSHRHHTFTQNTSSTQHKNKDDGDLSGNIGDWILESSPHSLNSSSSSSPTPSRWILSNIEFYQEFEILRDYYLQTFDNFSSNDRISDISVHDFESESDLSKPPFLWHTESLKDPSYKRHLFSSISKLDLISSLLHLIQLPSNLNSPDHLHTHTHTHTHSPQKEEEDLATYVHRHHLLLKLCCGIETSQQTNFIHLPSDVILDDIPIKEEQQKKNTSPERTIHHHNQNEKVEKIETKIIIQSSQTDQQIPDTIKNTNKSKLIPQLNLSRTLREQFFPSSQNETTLSHSHPSNTSLDLTEVYKPEETYVYSQMQIETSNPISSTQHHVTPRRKSLSGTITLQQTEQILWSGYLDKKGGKGLKSSWKKRFFILDGSLLGYGFRYFESSPTPIPPLTLSPPQIQGQSQQVHEEYNPYNSTSTTLSLAPRSRLPSFATPDYMNSDRFSDSTSSQTIDTMRSSINNALGAIPLLCCTIQTSKSSSGELIMTVQQQFVKSSVMSKNSSSPPSPSSSSSSTSSPWRRTNSTIKRKSAMPSESPRWSHLSSESSGGTTIGTATVTNTTTTASTPKDHSKSQRKSMFSRQSSTSISPQRSRPELEENMPTNTVGSTIVPSFSFANVLGVDLAMDFENLPSRTYYLRLGEDSEKLEHLLLETSFFVTISVFHAACNYSTFQTGIKTTLRIIECKSRVFLLARNCLYYLLERTKGKIDFLLDYPPTSPWKIEKQKVTSPTLERKSSFSHDPMGVTESRSNILALHAACLSLNSSILQLLLGTADEAQFRPSYESHSFFSKVWGKSSMHSHSIVENESSSSFYNEANWSLIDVNTPDKSGNTPLHLVLKAINTLRAEYQQSVEHLISINSSDIVEFDSEEENEALRCVMILLTQGAQVTCMNGDGKTPLHYTSYLPPSFARLLIEKGASIIAEDTQGVSPFFNWARCGNNDVLNELFNLLKTNYTQIYSIDKILELDDRPTDRSVLDGGDYALQSIVNTRNWNDGTTALFMAIENGHYKTVETLITEGLCDITIRDFNQNTVLIYAAKRYLEQILEILQSPLENNNGNNNNNNYSSNYSDSNNNHPNNSNNSNNNSIPPNESNHELTLHRLHLISMKYDQLIQILIDHGSDVNAINIRGQNCFHILCRIPLVILPSRLYSSLFDVTSHVFYLPNIPRFISDKSIYNLLSTPLNLTTPTYSGLYCHHYVSYTGNYLLLNILLNIKNINTLENKNEKILDVNLCGPNGNTCLDFISNELNKFNNSMTSSSLTNNTILKDCYEKCIELLLSYGAFQRLDKLIPVEQDTERLQFMGNRSGTYMMKSGYLLDILLRLVKIPKIQIIETEDDQQAFLLQYLNYCTSTELINYFVDSTTSYLNQIHETISTHSLVTSVSSGCGSDSSSSSSSASVSMIWNHQLDSFKQNLRHTLNQIMEYISFISLWFQIHSQLFCHLFPSHPNESNSSLYLLQEQGLGQEEGQGKQHKPEGLEFLNSFHQFLATIMSIIESALFDPLLINSHCSHLIKEKLLSLQDIYQSLVQHYSVEHPYNANNSTEVKEKVPLLPLIQSSCFDLLQEMKILLESILSSTEFTAQGLPTATTTTTSSPTATIIPKSVIVYDKSLGKIHEQSQTIGIVTQLNHLRRNSTEYNQSMSYVPISTNSSYSPAMTTVGLIHNNTNNNNNMSTINPFHLSIYLTIHEVIINSIVTSQLEKTSNFPLSLLLSTNSSRNHNYPPSIPSIEPSLDPLPQQEPIVISGKQLWGVTPIIMAQQLTLIMHSLLLFISPQELLNKHYKYLPLSPNFSLFKLISNQLIYIFASEILSQRNITIRASIILFYIHTAECCLKIRNLECVIILMTTLEMISIYRLKKTWKIVEETVPGKWMTLKSFVGTCGKNLDTEYLNLKSPNIPSMSNILKHFINIGEEPSYLLSMKEMSFRLTQHHDEIEEVEEEEGEEEEEEEESVIPYEDEEDEEKGITLELFGNDDDKTTHSNKTKKQFHEKDRESEREKEKKEKGKGEGTGHTKIINFHKIRKIGKLIRTLHTAALTLYPFDVDFNLLLKLFPSNSQLPSSSLASPTPPPSSSSPSSSLPLPLPPSGTKYPLYSTEDECYQQSLILEEKIDHSFPSPSPSSSSPSSSSPTASTTPTAGSLSSNPSSITPTGPSLLSSTGSQQGSSRNLLPLTQRSNSMLRKSLQKIKSSRF